MRQFFCAVLAVGVAAIVYFATKDILHKEVVGWLCIISAMPIAIAGFVTYHGLTFEKFIMKWIQSEIINPKHVVFKADNIYMNATKDCINTKGKKKKPRAKIEASPIMQKDIEVLVYKILKKKSDHIGYAKIKGRMISAILNIETKRIETALLALEDDNKIVPYKRGYYLISDNKRKELNID